MKIKMLSTQKGSQNGITVEKFEEGKVYNIAESLYEIFVNIMKCAVPFVEEKKVEVKTKPAPSQKEMNVDDKETKAYTKPKNKKDVGK